MNNLDPESPHQPDEVLAAFAVALGASGVAVTPGRTRAFLEAASLVGAGDASGVYWAGRATLCANVDDLERYGFVFDTWFSGHVPRAGVRRARARSTTQADLEGDDYGDGAQSAEAAMLRVSASTAEVLRHRDVAALSSAERAAVARLFGSLRPRLPVRRSSRRRPAGSGEIDARRTLREELRRGGEPSRLEYRARATRPRRAVVLIDVSGSMAPYADSLLRWAHALTRANRSGTEVFTMGTRLTRISRAMRLRDGDAALDAAGHVVPDWSGGTRLGEAVKVFLDRWGRRGVARGAVVVVMSDGWERGDCSLLGEQMSRLHRLAHSVVWVNPHQGKSGYSPVQGGIVAARPFVDHFVAGHSFATFEEALDVVAHA